MGSLLYVAFFLSGVSGLIYQVTWVRQFGNVLGNTVHSAALVVAVFMLGLGVGSYVAGVWADRRRYPGDGRLLRAYVAAEVVLAALGLGVSLLVPRLAALVAGWSSYTIGTGGWQELSTASHAAHAAAVIVLLTPVTVTMGATLTLLIRHLVRVDVGASGWQIARLYGANTAGCRRGRRARRLRARAPRRPAGHASRGRGAQPGRGRHRGVGAARCGSPRAGSRFWALWFSGATRRLPQRRAARRRKPAAAGAGGRALRRPVGCGRDGHGDGVGASPRHPARRVPRGVLAGARRAAGRERVGRARRRVAAAPLAAPGGTAGSGPGALRRLGARGTGCGRRGGAGREGPGHCRHPRGARAAAAGAGRDRVQPGARAARSRGAGVCRRAVVPAGECARATVRRHDRPARGPLYFANTAGAVAGSLGAGYVLLPRLGMQTTAAMLALVAAAALVPLLAAGASRRATMLAAAPAALALAAWTALPADFVVAPRVGGATRRPRARARRGAHRSGRRRRGDRGRGAPHQRACDVVRPRSWISGTCGPWPTCRCCRWRARSACS